MSVLKSSEWWKPPLQRATPTQVMLALQDKVDVLPTAHSNPQAFEWLLLPKSALEEHTYLDLLIAHGWYNPKF